MKIHDVFVGLALSVGFGVLSLGCTAEGGEEDVEAMEALPIEAEAEGEAQAWSDWVDVQSGVRQRSSARGALQTETRGIDGHLWLSAQIEEELEDLADRSESATAEEREGIESQIRMHGERLTDVDNTLAMLRAQDALESAWGKANTLGDGRGQRIDVYYAEAQAYYSGYGGAYAGAQQSYGWGPATSLTASAYVCMDGNCQGGSTSLTGTGIYKHSGYVNCTSGGGEFSGNSSVTVLGTTVSAQWAQHCNY